METSHSIAEQLEEAIALDKKHYDGLGTVLDKARESSSVHPADKIASVAHRVDPQSAQASTRIEALLRNPEAAQALELLSEESRQYIAENFS